jgi:GTP-binding protein
MIDQIKIIVRAGKGGDGIVAFRREKYVPKGGPNGGDGGKGGDLYFRTTTDLNTLEPFRYRKVFAAENGQRGGGSNLTGHGGKDLILDVPVGTIVKVGKVVESLGSSLAHNQMSLRSTEGPSASRRNGVIVRSKSSSRLKKTYDLVDGGQTILIACGGRGGRGNARFKTATNRTPRFAEPGVSGEEKQIELELKLLADVGIIGLPNVGKSTLISTLTAARPKIANYPFTTLEPNLGVLNHKGKTVVLADIPGLIEGASKGRGLGDEFLKHIERTKILVHLIDASTDSDKLKDFETVKKELSDFGQKLDKKPEVVVLSKVDLAQQDKINEEIAKFSKKKIRVLKISSFSGEGLDDLKDEIIKIVSRFKS